MEKADEKTIRTERLDGVQRRSSNETNIEVEVELEEIPKSLCSEKVEETYQETITLMQMEDVKGRSSSTANVKEEEQQQEEISKGMCSVEIEKNDRENIRLEQIDNVQRSYSSETNVEEKDVLEDISKSLSSEQMEERGQESVRLERMVNALGRSLKATSVEGKEALKKKASKFLRSEKKEETFQETIRLEHMDGIQRSSNLTRIEQENEVFEERRLNFGPFTIPLLITELILSIVDVLCDFWTGFSLLKLTDKVWGIGSFVINWIPGMIGVIQMIANRRCDGILWTTLYCLASLVLCPFVPTITFILLLCKVPRNSEEESSREVMMNYQKLLEFVTIVRAMEGCIESPLQLLYKIFLMFNGIIEFKFTSATFEIEDLHGNNIPVPFLMNFLIAGVTLLKSVYTLNMPFFKSESTSKYFNKLAWLDFVSFLVTSTMFKLGSLILLFGYLNIYAILPIFAIIFFEIAANTKTIRDYQNIPNWLVVFMNIFVPICFSTKTNEDISKVQEKNLKYNTWISSMIYGFSLVNLGLLVYFSKLNMYPDLPITFATLRVFISSTILLGVLAVIFSFRMNILNHMPIWEKIVQVMVVVLRIIALGILASSFVLTILFPIEEYEEASFVIWNKNVTDPITLTGQVIVPPKLLFMNMTLKSLKTVKAEEFWEKRGEIAESKPQLIIILDDAKAKPSSPLLYDYHNVPTIFIRDPIAPEAFKFPIEVYEGEFLIEIMKESTKWKIYISQFHRSDRLRLKINVLDAKYPGSNQDWELTLKDNDQGKQCTTVTSSLQTPTEVSLRGKKLGDCRTFLQHYARKDFQKSLKLEFKPKEKKDFLEVYGLSIYNCNKTDAGSNDTWTIEILDLCKTNPITNFTSGEWKTLDSKSTLGDCFTKNKKKRQKALSLQFESDGKDDMMVCKVTIVTKSNFRSDKYLGKDPRKWIRKHGMESFWGGYDWIEWGPLKIVNTKKNKIKLRSVQLKFCDTDCDNSFIEYVATDIINDWYLMKDGFELTLKRQN